VEVRYVAGGTPPPPHRHPEQEERFEVLEGAMHFVIADREQVHGPGSRFVVPRGTVHTMHAVGDDVARLRWQIRPALATQTFFVRTWTLPAEGSPPLARLLALAAILHVHRREFQLARPPAWAQRVAFGTLAAVARLLRQA
jgi:hypothetical protein